MVAGRIHPVMLSGGAGSRLWPLSRETSPKQLLKLAGERSLLQDTALRTADPARFAPLTLVCNLHHRFAVAEQLQEIGVPVAAIALEPVGRNTAAAVAVAALMVAEADPEGLMLSMHADHVITDVPAFLDAVEQGVPAAQAGDIVLLGVKPAGPATGYGYIHMGEPLPAAPGVRRVKAFVEKPKLALAQQYVAGGEHLWNAGIFLLPVTTLLAEMERFEPAVLAAARAALAKARRDDDFVRLDATEFGRAPSIAIDNAVLERTSHIAVVPVDCGWTDVGSWSSLWDLGSAHGEDNVTVGEVMADAATRRSYLRTEGPFLAVIGVEDLIVVATADAVLVAHKSRDQEVKAVVDQLKARGHATTPPAGGHPETAS